MADLHRAVRRLYQLTDVSAFTRPDLDMGLHIVSLLDTGAPSCEHHVRSIDQLHPGCVLEMRNKLWRAIAQYSICKEVKEVDQDLVWWQQARQHAHVALTNQTSSRLAYGIATVINSAIILSTISFVYSTIPHFRAAFAEDPSATLPFAVWLTETICAMIFTAELAARLVALPRLADARHHPTLAVDVLALLPWYAQLVSGRGLKVLSVLRVLRCIRILMMFRATKQLVSLLGGTVQRAANMLLLLVCVTTMWIGVLAGALFAVERGAWDPARQMFVQTVGLACPVRCPGPSLWGAYAGCSSAEEFTTVDIGLSYAAVAGADCTPIRAESAFSTLPRCLWFATVSIVTVGYGDMVPATAAGRCVSVLAMLAGTLVIALPVTVVGSTFNTVFHSMAAREPAVAEIQEAAEVTCVTHAHGGSAARSPLASSYAEAAPARLRHRIRLAGDARSSSGVSRSERPRGRRRLASWEMRRGSPPRGAAASRTTSRRPMAGTLGAPLASMMHTLSSHSEPEFAALIQPDAPDASSEEEGTEQTISARFWHRRGVYLAFTDADAS